MMRVIIMKKFGLTAVIIFVALFIVTCAASSALAQESADEANAVSVQECDQVNATDLETSAPQVVSSGVDAESTLAETAVTEESSAREAGIDLHVCIQKVGKSYVMGILAYIFMWVLIIFGHFVTPIAILVDEWSTTSGDDKFLITIIYLVFLEILLKTTGFSIDNFQLTH